MGKTRSSKVVKSKNGNGSILNGTKGRRILETTNENQRPKGKFHLWLVTILKMNQSSRSILNYHLIVVI